MPTIDNGLTVDEQRIMDNLGEIYAIFASLDDHDIEDVKRAIRTIQTIIARRIVQRLFPDYWR